MHDSITGTLDPLLTLLRQARGLEAPITALDLRLGERCRFKNPVYEADQGDFIAAYVQLDFKGRSCYRVVPDTPPPPGGHFGRLAHPEDLVWLKPGEHAPGVIFQKAVRNATALGPDATPAQVRRAAVAQCYGRLREARRRLDTIVARGDDPAGYPAQVREARGSLLAMRQALGALDQRASAERARRAAIILLYCRFRSARQHYLAQEARGTFSRDAFSRVREAHESLQDARQILQASRARGWRMET